MPLKIVSPEFFEHFKFVSCAWSDEFFTICVIPKPWFLEMGEMNEILLTSLNPHNGFSSDKWKVISAYGVFYAESLLEFKNKMKPKNDYYELNCFIARP